MRMLPSSFDIGWSAAGLKSMIARRRKPRPIEPSGAIQDSAPSGPRWRIVSRILSRRSGCTAERPSPSGRMPTIPHIRRVPARPRSWPAPVPEHDRPEPRLGPALARRRAARVDDDAPAHQAAELAGVERAVCAVVDEEDDRVGVPRKLRDRDLAVEHRVVLADVGARAPESIDDVERRTFA